MTWTAPRNANVGDLFTAAWYNAEIRDNLGEVWFRLATATIAADATFSGTSESSPTSLLSVTADADGYPVRIAFGLRSLQKGASATDQPTLSLWEDSTHLGRIFVADQVGAGGGFPVADEHTYTPADGSHTWAVKGHIIGGGGSTAQVRASTGGSGNYFASRITVWRKGAA